jgi:hypothetical protein
VVAGTVDDTFAQSFDWGPQVPDIPLEADGDIVPDGPDEVFEIVDAGDADAGDVDAGDADTKVEVIDGCSADLECLVLDDGNLCNGAFACVEGQCSATEAPEACSQSDAPPCRVAVCDPPTGQCRFEVVPNGSECDDDDSCTLDDVCLDGACAPGPRIYCDDGNACTLDKCVNGSCKVTAVNGLPCDDGNPCTTDESCSQVSGGTCKSNVSVCSCSSDAECDAYDDGNACNGLMKCVAGLCKTTTPVVCSLPGKGSCEAQLCNQASGLCETVSRPDGSGCSDDDACTTGDLCTAGACAGTPTECPNSGCSGMGACNSGTGVCEYTDFADGTDCGEESGCLTGATCAEGACLPSSDACACTTDEECADQEDGDLCNGSLGCVAGRCVVLPDSVPACPEITTTQCQSHSCDPATGECVILDADEGATCDDGDICTESDSCAAGSCVGAPNSCDEGSSCELAICHPFAGCVLRPVGGACIGGGACATNSGCVWGACVAVESTLCESTNPCLQVACDPDSDGCVEAPVVAACDDEDPCTENDACGAGECKGLPVLCDDGNPCTTGVCNGDGSCSSSPLESVVCDDGNGCTSGDQCYDGFCTGIVALGCGCSEDEDCDQHDDGNPCNGVMICGFGVCAVDEASIVICDPSSNTICLENVCDPGTGECAESARAEGAACEDGDLCTAQGACVAGSCVSSETICDDGDPCTDDFCDAETGACAVAASADDASCDDGNPCTTDTTCTAAACGGGTNSCEACIEDSDCAADEDGDLCNGTLVCADGACVVDGATVVGCSGTTSPCSDLACNPSTGACEVSEPSGDACEDGDPCTVGDSCSGGACVAGEALVCGEDTGCANHWCDPIYGGCVVQNTEATCNDDDTCTQGDGCYGGACLFIQNICSCDVDGDCEAFYDKCQGTSFCTAGIGCGLEPDTEVVCGAAGDTPCAFEGCDPETGGCAAVVVEPGAACDDNNACTVNTLCDAEGLCAGEAVVCDDGNPCTDDFCDAADGCVFTVLEDDTECDDGDACKVLTKCTAGVCGGGGQNPQCKCLSGLDSQCAIYDDDDKCNGEYQCLAKKCVRSEPVTCQITGFEPCKFNGCDPGTGNCSLEKASEGTDCDDDDPCTENDICKFTLGQCQGKSKNCLDGDLCTEDSCIDGICFSDEVPFWTTGQLNASPECVDGAPGSGCDGNICTKVEKCESGVLTFLDVCDGCGADNDCTFGDTDGDKCNGIWRCLDIDEATGKGYCQFDPESVVTCEDDDPFDCIYVSCLPQTGTCFPEEGTGCDDGSVCTDPDACFPGGACVGTVLIECSDPNVDDCVDIACHPVHGTCEPTVRPDGAACSDSNACTVGDICVSGGCHGSLIPCDDLNPCTDNACSAETGCIFPSIFIGECDDGDPCSQATVCKNGECTNGQNSPACGCDNAVDCVSFDDGDVCTGVWDCVGGSCEFKEGTEKDCDSEINNPCVVGTCEADSGICGTENRADGTLCDDGDSCNKLGACQAGVCVTTALCGDDDPCTDDTCFGGACSYLPAADGEACDLDDPCSENDVCEAGLCAAGDGVACACGSDADCDALDDGDLCNGTLLCISGQCRVNPTTVVSCQEDSTGCTAVSCDAATGSCFYDLIATGLPCNDGDACTADDRCDAVGLCGGSAVGCADDDACTHDLCDPSYGCVHFAFVGPCDDGNPCTKDDICSDGQCDGVLDGCDDGNPCSKDICKPGVGCTNPLESNNKSCSNGDVCTIQDKCQDGVCEAGNPSPSCSCAADEDCVQHSEDDHCAGTYICEDSACVFEGASVQAPLADPGICGSVTCVDDGAGGWVYQLEALLEGDPCDDLDDCTEATTCQAGACTGSVVDCGEPVNPCSEIVCYPELGCQFQDRIGACDDGSACSVDDRCVADDCTGDPSLGPVATFEDQTTDDWLLTSTGNEAGWYISAGIAADSGAALHAVNPSTGTMEDAGGAWEAEAEWMVVSIPAEAINEVFIRFKVWMDVGDQGCEADRLNVLVDGASVYERCDSTDGAFVEVEIDLGQDPKGDDLVVTFVVNTVTADNNGGAGVVIDDAGFHWACKVL